MKILLQKGSTLILIAMLAVTVFFAYNFFDHSALAQDLTQVQNSQTALVSSAVEGMLEKIESIDFSGALFTNQTFLSLHDFMTPLTPEPAGRSNPFAPLSGVPSPSAASSVSK